MKAAYLLGLRRYLPGALDAHGNPVDAWADPVDWTVYAVAPASSQEPAPDRLAVVSGVAVLAPPGLVPDPLDRVVYDGSEWAVEGEPADYTRGPFGSEPGVSVTLRRVEG